MDERKKGDVTKQEFRQYMVAMHDKAGQKHDGRVTQEEWLKRIWPQPWGQ